MGSQNMLLVLGACSCLLVPLAAGSLERRCRGDNRSRLKHWPFHQDLSHAVIPWFDQLTIFTTYPLSVSPLLTQHFSPFPLQLLPRSNLWYFDDFGPPGLAGSYHRPKHNKHQVPATSVPVKEQEKVEIKDIQGDTNEDEEKSRKYEFELNKNHYSGLNLEELLFSETDIRQKHTVDLAVHSDHGKLSSTLPGKETELLELYISDYQPSDITVRLEGNHLHVAAKHILKGCNENYKGCVTRQFHKSYRLPSKVDSQFMSAKMNSDGTLRIYSHLKDSEKLIEEAEQFEPENTKLGGEKELQQTAPDVQFQIMKENTEDLKNIGDVYADDDVTIEVTA